MRRLTAFRVLGFICRNLGCLGFDLGCLRMHVIHTKKAKHHHSCSRFVCDCYVADFDQFFDFSACGTVNLRVQM